MPFFTSPHPISDINGEIQNFKILIFYERL